MSSIILATRSGGGFKVTINSSTVIRFSRADYYADDYGVKLWTTDSNQLINYKFTPQEWIIAGVNTYSTVDDVCQALENIGILRASEPIVGASTAAKQDALLAALIHSNEYGPFNILITRPANHGTGYTQDMTIGDVSGALQKVLNIVSTTGKPFKITGIHVQTNDEGFAGAPLLVHVYQDDIVPTADKSVLTIDPINKLKRVGSIPVVIGTGLLKTVGINDVINLQARPVDTGLRCQITVNGAGPYVPLLDSSWIMVTFYTAPIN